MVTTIIHCSNCGDMGYEQTLYPCEQSELCTICWGKSILTMMHYSIPYRDMHCEIYYNNVNTACEFLSKNPNHKLANMLKQRIESDKARFESDKGWFRYASEIKNTFESCLKLIQKLP